MHDVETYRNSAHGAMVAFGAVFAASMLFLYYDAHRSEVDAHLLVAEAMMMGTTTSGQGQGTGRRLRTYSHDSGSDDGSYGGSDDEAEGVVTVRQRSLVGGCIRQRNNCFPDRNLV